MYRKGTAPDPCHFRPDPLYGINAARKKVPKLHFSAFYGNNRERKNFQFLQVHFRDWYNADIARICDDDVGNLEMKKPDSVVTLLVVFAITILVLLTPLASYAVYLFVVAMFLWYFFG